jgi:predicted RecA/RadA family phage recombinase
MKNFVSDGNVINHILDTDITTGQGVLRGQLFGIAVSTALSGAEIALCINGVVELPAASADTFAIGDKVGFDESAQLAVMTGDGAKDLDVGVCVRAKTAGQTTVQFLISRGV